MTTSTEKLTDRNRVRDSFKALRKLGYFCRMNFWCCQSCGWAAMTDEQSKKAVFYHNQDHDGAWNEWNDLTEYGIHLAWSGDGNEICKVLREHGLAVEWDGSEDHRILIKHAE